jgi:ATP/maltotriose-dependent transcriptional regulator MalT
MREAVVMLLRRMRPGANVVELDRIGGIEAVKQHGARPDHAGPEAARHHRRLGRARSEEALSRNAARRAVRSPAADAEEQCIEAGADIYIEKSSGAQEIGNALRALLSADGQFEELAPTDNKLSKRQKQLIVMLDRGLSNREIADELGISEHTVKVHLWRLFRRWA